MAELNNIIMDKKVQSLIISATKKGRQDGRNSEIALVVASINSIKANFQGLVLDLKGQADEKLFKDRGMYSKYDYEIGELSRTINDEFLSNKMGRLDSESERRLQDSNSNHEVIMNEIGEEINNLEEAKEEAKSELKTITKEINSLHLDNHINPKWGIIIITILTFLEIPFTHSAFLILKTSPAISIVVAILLSAVLAISAHFVGQSVRSGKHKFVASVAFIVSVLAIFVVSHFRTLHANGQQLDMSKIFAPEDLYFIIIGGVIYFICIAVSYYSHNSDEDARKKLEKLKVQKGLSQRIIKNSDEEIKNQKNKRNKAIKFLQENRNEIRADFENRKVNLKEDKDKKDKIDKRREAAIKFNAILDSYQVIEQGINESFKSAIENYKGTYIKERMHHFQVLDNGTRKVDDTVEKVFESIGELILPLSLENKLPVNKLP